MENIRCIIADIPHIMLADIIQQITNERSGIEVVGRINDSSSLPKNIKDQGIDIVICGMRAMSVSPSLNELFYASPETVAVGIVEDGRRICVCVEDIGPDELVELIKVTYRNRHPQYGAGQ